LSFIVKKRETKVVLIIKGAIMDFPTINWAQVGDNLLRIVVAFALAFPIGWERGYGRYSIGFRTIPIVAMASCGYVLIAKAIPGATAETQARLIQGLVGGIGFIGGGAILKEGVNVGGIVTAATIWNTAAIGVAVASETLEIAIVLSLMNFFTLFFLTPIAKLNKKLREIEQEIKADKSKQHEKS
jgi:putative Mg2+ transporter-C (MgtC) family protein